jgi:putative endonuclease
MNKYFVYILKFANNSYYTVVTNNLDRRLFEHNEGIDSKCYTFSRRPVERVFKEGFQNPEQAIEKEKQIKGWSRVKKEALINEDFVSLVKLSKSKTE